MFLFFTHFQRKIGNFLGEGKTVFVNVFLLAWKTLHNHNLKKINLYHRAEIHQALPLVFQSSNLFQCKSAI